MKLVNKKKVTRLQMLLGRSEEIKNIFTHTMNDLQQVNEEIEREVENKIIKIEHLKLECSILNETKYNNEKMRSKMATLLGLEEDVEETASVTQQ